MEEASENMHHHDVNYDNSHNDRMHDGNTKDEHIRLDQVKHKQPPAVVHENLLNEEVNDSTDVFNEVKSFE